LLSEGPVSKKHPTTFIGSQFLSYSHYGGARETLEAKFRDKTPTYAKETMTFYIVILPNK
jgi:hypothetical protein